MSGSILHLRAAQIATQGVSPTLQAKARLLAGDLMDQPASDFDGVAIMLLPREQDLKLVTRYSAVKKNNLHCTLLYLGDAAEMSKSPEEVRDALVAWAGRTYPIQARLGGVIRFSGKDDDPVVLSVDSPHVHEAHKRVTEILGAIGVFSGSDHGFTAHMTLGYLPKNERLDLATWKPQDIIFDRIRIGYGGKNCDLVLGINNSAEEFKNVAGGMAGGNVSTPSLDGLPDGKGRQRRKRHTLRNRAKVIGEEAKAFDPDQPRDNSGKWMSTVHVESALEWRMKPDGFDEEQIEKYAEQMRDGSFRGAVQVEMTPHGPLLTDGHHKLEAARRLGRQRIPAMIFDDSAEGRMAALRHLNAIEREKKAMMLTCSACGKEYAVDSEQEIHDHQEACEAKDVFTGAAGLEAGRNYQHGHPVPRKKRKVKMRAMTISMVPNSTKALPKDGDGDGWINDTTNPTPAPPGTPVVGDLVMVGKSPYKGCMTVADAEGNHFHIGSDEEGHFAMSDDEEFVVDNGKTRKQVLELLDKKIKRGDIKPVAKPKGRPVADGAKKPLKKAPAKKTSSTKKRAASVAAGKPAAKKTTAKKTTAKRTAKDPNEFGARVGTEFQVAGENETAKLEGQIIVGSRRLLDGSKSVRQMTLVKPGSKTEAYLRKKYGIPPKYTEIKFNHSRNEKAGDNEYDGFIYAALDPTQEKWQPVYTVRHRLLKNGVKEQKVGGLAKSFAETKALLIADTRGNDKKKKAAAQAVLVQALTGLRIGSTENAAEGSYGASTLERRHVKISGDKVTFAFDGKGRQKRLDDSGNPVLDENGKVIWDRGSPYKATVTDPDLAAMLREAMDGKKPNDRLFDNADHNVYLKGVSKTLGITPAITTHNFRHHFATALAAKMLEGRKPKTEESFQLLQRQVVEAVAAAINDTKKIAFGSYIQSNVWDRVNRGGEFKNGSIK